jgi:inorganic pyrophosphatase
VQHHPDQIPATGPHGSFNVVVESPRGATSKFKYEPAIGAIMLSRPLPAGTAYPHDWGFIPSTRAEDGDPLDVMIIWDGVSYPGVVIPCRLIGVLRVEQRNTGSGRRERNDRLAAVPAKAPDLEDLRSIFAVAKRKRAELERFFLNAVAFEHKDLAILGWSGPAEAKHLVRRSLVQTQRTTT